ncbi:MAG: transposase [Cupriavidus necator]
MLSRLFQRLFLARLQHAFEAGALSLLLVAGSPRRAGCLPPRSCRHTPYRMGGLRVYAKEPFGGPRQVLDYLGRYTHRVAISNNRLLELTDEHVTFRWKDYRHPAKPHAMSLPAHEFI